MSPCPYCLAVTILNFVFSVINISGGIFNIGINGNPNGSNVILYDFKAFKNKTESMFLIMNQGSQR